LALARIAQGRERLSSFSDLEEPLTHLLKDFGPPRKSAHPEYPFWRLQSDKLWDVPNSEALVRRKGHSDPLKSELRERHIQGGFPKQLYEVFRRDRRFLQQVASVLLEAHFPTSLHEDILNEIGLSLTTNSIRRRDPQFRYEV